MRKATIEDKKLVSEILVSAFLPLQESNSINFVVKQDQYCKKRMSILMEYLFERAILFGEVYLSDNNNACVLLKFSDSEKTTLKTLKMDVNLALKCIGLTRVYKVFKRQRLAKKNYPKEKHIRPVLVGVKTDCKGNGTAARLILEVKNKFKNNALPVILDTTSENHVKLYQKLGFKIIKKRNF